MGSLATTLLEEILAAQIRSLATTLLEEILAAQIRSLAILVTQIHPCLGTTLLVAPIHPCLATMVPEEILLAQIRSLAQTLPEEMLLAQIRSLATMLPEEILLAQIRSLAPTLPEEILRSLAATPTPHPSLEEVLVAPILSETAAARLEIRSLAPTPALGRTPTPIR